MLANSLRMRMWIALTVAVLLGGMLFPVQSAGAALSKQALDRAVLSTVKILIIDGDNNVFGSCSGTHLGNGYIVTNWHCVGHTDLYGTDDTGMGLKNGDTYNPDGIVAIAPTTDAKKLPKPTFFAKLLAGNPDVDVAVVRIYGMIDKNTPLPKALPMAQMTLDDSDQVGLDDNVYVFGYPGAGGEMLTYTTGKIAGYEDQNTTDNLDHDSFKTTAAINPGNSGGLAVDDKGNQIGIPTFTEGTGTGIGGLREINIAVPYINQALKLGGAAPISGTTTVSNTTPTAPPANGPFGAIAFGTAVQNGKLVSPGTAFPTGTTQIIGAFGFQNMRNGMKWGWIWQFNGKAVLDSRNTQTWSDGAKGTTGVQISNDKGLPDGSYGLQLYVNNSLVQQGPFTIGATTAPPKATPPPQNKGVTLKGRIVDADTARGIAGGVLVVLKPGTTIDQFDNSKGDALVAAVGVADKDGNYLTAPGLDRQKTYTVIVAAKGYARRVFEDGLDVTTADPGLVKLDDLSLQKP